ncbi:hypothetical protein COCVIDRAFT_31238 [Bipolaris victoriae FI3]|uniref:Uncharacterized protein n=1 Tax=Bipolaris victoriae (strain FI3) TaxID=930091 RepID=W7E3A6_BIPV3|nr:hypothetical protein COCVIDRAFT_31238 [Bipolaris victoriae FI3]
MPTQSKFEPIRTAWHDLKHDLKSTRWLRGFGWTLGVFWLFGLIVSAIMVGMMSAFITTNSACLPDSSFRLKPDTFSMWSSTGFFQITLGGGDLSFAEAKLVDIVWDIGVGRGGQVVLAFISWREFARYLTIFFRTIFIENDASVLSIFRTIKSFITQRRLRSKIAMAFMTATMLFILAFLTLMSAISGYNSNVSSRVPDLSDNLVSFGNFSRVLYFIQDGSRINKSDNLWVLDETSRIGRDPVIGNRPGFKGDLAYGVSLYVEAYGLGGRRNESSIFDNSTFSYPKGENFTLNPPTLNITAYTLEDTAMKAYNMSGAQGMTWIRNGELFNRTYIENKGQCQNTGTYKWGFSFLQLFFCILLLLAWTIGIYIMWLYTHYTLLLRSRLSEEVSGAHRAVLELAAAMQSELDLAELDVSLLREKQLEERIKKEIRGGTVSYAYAEEKREMFSIRKGLREWWRKDKWWFMALFCMTVLCSTFWMAWIWWLWIWLWSFWFGQFWAFCIGTTEGSRLLIILFWGVFGAIVVAVAIPATTAAR